MIKSPIGWVGGKSRLRAEILKRIPDHTTYVEPFCGAAWVLFGKKPSAVEIINDIDGELTNFWRCVRERPLELLEKLRFRLACKPDFQRERDLSQGSEIERAARFYWLLKSSFGSRRTRPSFGFHGAKDRQRRPGLDVKQIQQVLTQAHERLQDVYVFTEDFEELIKRSDSTDTFFYVDPPYWGCEKAYVQPFATEDHERLAATLKPLKGRFLLSYGDHASIRALYNWAEIEEVSTRYSISKTAEGRARRTELLIRNYRL